MKELTNIVILIFWWAVAWLHGILKSGGSFCTSPGYGDEATWGPCTGHPGDPRTPDIDDEDEDIELEYDDTPEDDLHYDHL